MNLSVIIPTYNRTNVLIQTLHTAIHLLDKDTIVFEIIVVNDGDSDIEYKNNHVKIIKNAKKGVASARNLGVAHANFDNLLLLDDDILLTEEALNTILVFLVRENQKQVLNIYWKYPNELLNKLETYNFGRFLIKNRYVSMEGWMGVNELPVNTEFEIDALASYCLVIKKSMFERVGGYNEQFTFAGFEDYEFAIRVKKSGIKTFLNTQSVVWHNEFDRLDVTEWFNRRYREGVTRAIYVKETKDEGYKIMVRFAKRILFEYVYFAMPLLLFKLKLFNKIKLFDTICFVLYKLLTGACIYKGYRSVQKKN